jgi:trk system potassium uptake protein TrkA
VILCGGGRVSYYLAKQLERSGIGVTLIEQNYDRCVQLSAALPGVSVIHGDASDSRLLESEGLDECDALVTLTGLDEMNMVISLQGTVQKVPQVITKLSRAENMHVVDLLPIGSTISPKQLCCNTIVCYVRALRNQSGAARTIHTIADGHAEALEFLVDGDAWHIGQPLKNLRLKKNVLIGCITHRGRQEIPAGDSFYEQGDTVIVVTSGGVVLNQFNDIFEA